MDPDLTIATFRSGLERLQGQARRFRKLAFEIEREGWLRSRALALADCVAEMKAAALEHHELERGEWIARPTPLAHFMGCVAHDLKNRIGGLQADCAHLFEAPRREIIEDAERLAGRAIFLCKAGNRLLQTLSQSAAQRSDTEEALTYLRRREQRSWERSLG